MEVELKQVEVDPLKKSVRSKDSLNMYGLNQTEKEKINPKNECVQAPTEWNTQKDTKEPKNKLNSHTVWQRCIQYSMRQYVVVPEFLTRATPKRLGERIKWAAEGKHSQGIQMDRSRERVSLVLHDATRRLQSVKIVMKIGELNDQIKVGEMTQGIVQPFA